ncbi:MAG: ABC transporter permease [Bacteroidota bacterium]|nr:ABC transporter permease [Bacteroidota bacterium]
MKNSFLLNTRAEFLKTKGTAAPWLTLLAAAFLPAINALILINRPDIFVNKLHQDPWLILFYMTWKNGAGLILPVFVILINSVIVQVEYRNNTWKQVYASPRTYADIFFSKFVVVQAFLLFFIIVFTVFTILSGYFVNLFHSEYLFSSHPFRLRVMLVVISRVYAGILGVTAIQYGLSMRFKNFVVPLGIGISLLIAGLILSDWDKIVYYPYLYSLLLFFIGSPSQVGSLGLGLLLVNSVICLLLAASLGCWDIYKRKERG